MSVKAIFSLPPFSVTDASRAAAATVLQADACQVPLPLMLVKDSSAEKYVVPTTCTPAGLPEKAVMSVVPRLMAPVTSSECNVEVPYSAQ